VTTDMWALLGAGVFAAGLFVIISLAPCPHSHVWPTKDFQGEFIFVCAYCKRIQRRDGMKWFWTRQTLKQLYEEARQQQQKPPVQ
jgi:hypothetical protein